MRTFHGYVLDGEAKDDGPDHSQGHLGVAVDDLCGRGRGHSTLGSDIIVTHLRDGARTCDSGLTKQPMTTQGGSPSHE